MADEFNFERGEKTPTPKISALLRKRPVLLRANFGLTKERKRPYYGHFCGKMHKKGSCGKAAGGHYESPDAESSLGGGGLFPSFNIWFWLQIPNDIAEVVTDLMLGVQELEIYFRESQEGCGGLRGENPEAFPKAGPIFQQLFSLPENA